MPLRGYPTPVIFKPTDSVDGVTLSQPDLDHDKVGFRRHQRERNWVLVSLGELERSQGYRGSMGD
jgi:hypothetical protein